MAFYVLLASFLFFGSFTKQAKYFYKISLVSLFALTALRNPTWGGYDSLSYIRIYNSVPKIQMLANFKSDYAIGYIFLNSIVKTVFDNYILFQVVLAVITFALLYMIIEKSKLDDSEKCIFLFSYFCYRFMWNTWVTYRQNIANLIVWLFMLCFWEKREKKNELILIGGSTAACVFHSSAVVNLFLIPCARIVEKWKVKMRMIVVAITSVFLWLFGNRIFSMILNFAAELVDSRYKMYGMSSVGTSNIINYIFRLLLFLWMSIIYDKSKYKYKSLAISALSIMVILGSLSSELMNRVYEYYAIGLYLTFAICLSAFHGKSRLVAAIIYYVVMIIILVRGVMTFSGGVFVSYQALF